MTRVIALPALLLAFARDSPLAPLIRVVIPATAYRLLRALPPRWIHVALVLGTPAWADHGGPLAAAPMTPLTVALLAAGLAFVTVVLLVVIWRLLARPGRRAE